MSSDNEHDATATTSTSEVNEVQNTEPRKATEAEVIQVITWLKNEIQSIDSDSDKLKSERILEAAQKLKAMGFREKGIAAELARHAKELNVDRSTIYEALPVEFKNKERSEAISAGRQEMSETRHTTDDAKDRIVVEAGGANSRENGENDNASGGFVGSSSAAANLGGANTGRQQLMETFEQSVKEFVNLAVYEGDSVRFPKDAWEKFYSSAAKTGIVPYR